MELEVGSLENQPDGGLAGVLCTLTIRAQLELRPITDASDRSRRFIVIAGTGAAVGECRLEGDGFSLTVYSPELLRPLKLKVTPADNRGARRIIWSTEE